MHPQRRNNLSKNITFSFLYNKPTLYLWQALRENEAEIGATYVNGVIMIVWIFSKLIFQAILKSYPGTRFRENKT